MRYEYVPVNLKNIVVKQARVVDNEHQKVIDQRAKQGQKFVGMVPTVSGANGKILAFDLVFEIDD